jgi:hypothetical protein
MVFFGKFLRYPLIHGAISAVGCPFGILKPSGESELRSV